MMLQAGYGDRWQTQCFDPFSSIFGGIGLGALLGAGTGLVTHGNVGEDALFGGLAGGATAGLGAVFGGSGGAVGGAAGDAGGATGIGADTGATFADSLTPATTGVTGGAIDAGTFASDAGIASSGLGGAADTLTSLGGATSADPGFAPGVATSAPVTASAPATQNIAALNGVGAAPGPSVEAFAPPAGVPASTLDPTSAASFGAQGALVPSGTNQIATDVTSNAASGGSAAANAGALGVTDTGSFGAAPANGGLTIAPDNVAALNSGYAQGFSDTGSFGAAPANGGLTIAPDNVAALNTGIPATTAAGPQSTLQEIGGGITNAAKWAWNGASSGLDSLGKAIESPTGKVLGVGLTGAGLVENLLKSQQSLPGMSQQGSIAAGAAAQGTLLSQYLTKGTLPPGVQSSINQALNSAITAIRSRHAAQGTSGSSTEQQEIAAAQQNATTQGVNIADQLLSAGSTLTSLSANVYQALVSENQALNTGVNQAVGNLAYVLGGGTGTKQPTSATVPPTL